MTSQASDYDWIVIGSGFGGSGPARTGCTRCGADMVGCRVGARNTLLRNCLRFARTLFPFGWGRRTVVFLVKGDPGFTACCSTTSGRSPATSRADPATTA